MHLVGKTTTMLLVVALAAQDIVSTASPAATTVRPRISSATVKAITDALHSNRPEIALQQLRQHNLSIDTPLTGKRENIIHLIAGLPDDNISRNALDHLLTEAATENMPVNAADSDGLRPLHRAALLGNFSTAELLMVRGARANLQDASGKSPRDYAADAGHTQLATLLQQYATAQRGAGIEEAAGEEETTETTEIPPFLINLNERAAAGEIDPLIGRVEEIMMVMQVLSQREKNNPLLVGPAGVGKTAIIEGIADLIVSEEAPPDFIDKTLYTIDIAALSAGTGERGALEERVLALLEFAEKNPDTLFFIDEVHLIAAADGINIADLLKPALARGTLRCIGATTDAEYHQHILSDKALNRRFKKISIEEPSKEEAIEIAFGVRERLVDHHGIKVADEAIIAAVELAHHFPDQKLPDASLSLLDEALAAQHYGGSKLKLSLRDIAGKITRRETSLRIQSSERKKQLKAEIKRLQNMQNQQEAELEKHIDSKLAGVTAELHELENKPAKKEELKKKTSSKLKRLQNAKTLQARHIAELIAQKLRIPVEKILREEQNSIVNLEAALQQRIFGQDRALAAITDTLTVSYAGLAGSGRTLGAFMLMGPTGTGKTYTAKILADHLFGDEKHLLRFDMSEYQEAHTISLLLGAPPGYVGFGQGGTLTSAVLQTPHAVILFDEAEKAHPEFQNILLQILDGARLTDRSGETVDFSNVIVVMTSNSDDIGRDFRPEVRNRIDNILTYNSLESTIMGQLVMEQLNSLNAMLREQQATVYLSDAAIAQLSQEGYDPAFGARPLRRVFERRVTLPISKLIVDGKLKEGRYQLDITDEGIELTRE